MVRAGVMAGSIRWNTGLKTISPENACHRLPAKGHTESIMSTTTNNQETAGQPNGIVRTLRDLKAGDIVFVVRQQRRRESTVYTSDEKVSRVGRKYGYIQRGYLEEKFDLETGISVHVADCNARANGFGFDVYITEDEYLVKKINDDQKSRLTTRLVTSFGGLVDLPPDVVNEIHGLLDDAELA